MIRVKELYISFMSSHHSSTIKSESNNMPVVVYILLGMNENNDNENKSMCLVKKLIPCSSDTAQQIRF